MTTACCMGTRLQHQCRDMSFRIKSNMKRVLTGHRIAKARKFGPGCSTKATSFDRDSQKNSSYRLLCRSNDSSSDRASSDEYELQKLEVEEPAIEQGAEQAALSVVAATIFGAILWGVLGSTKGEGMYTCMHSLKCNICMILTKSCDNLQNILPDIYWSRVCQLTICLFLSWYFDTLAPLPNPKKRYYHMV